MLIHLKVKITLTTTTMEPNLSLNFRSQFSNITKSPFGSSVKRYKQAKHS